MDLTNIKYLNINYGNLTHKLSAEVRKYILKDIAKRYFKKSYRIMDYGTGNGNWLIPLKYMGYKNLCGVDIDNTYADSFQKHGVEFKRVYLGREKLPYEDNSFDVIMSYGVLEHIENIDQFMAEIKRVLKKGGLFINDVPDMKKYFLEFYDDPTHCRPFTKDSIRKTYEFYSFKVIENRSFMVRSPFGITRLWKVYRKLLYSGHDILCVGRNIK